ncbi:MAG: hypothetical protein IJO29_01340 [Oscillospiraceae bacterium]|nr:hypothetical protein [Oscillospiraceae bacterium]
MKTLSKLALSALLFVSAFTFIACDKKQDSSSLSDSGSKLSAESLELSQFNDVSFDISAIEPTEVANAGAFSSPDTPTPYYIYDSVYITMDKTDYKADETLEYTLHNETENEIGGSDYYQLEVLIDENWYVIPRKSMMDIASIISTGESVKHINLGNLCEDFAKGQYRIIFNYDMGDAGEICTSLIACAEFNIID